nr:zinc ribbon domain-containing protein [Lactobacillus helveticus]
MSHVASKGMHRSMFGLFRQLLAYKCAWYDKELILANKLYPSTQRCAVCGMVKRSDEKVTLKGNKKHGTKHNEYVCYNSNCPNYGKVVDRDENAMKNLTLLISHPELNKAL